MRGFSILFIFIHIQQVLCEKQSGHEYLNTVFAFDLPPKITYTNLQPFFASVVKHKGILTSPKKTGPKIPISLPMGPRLLIPNDHVPPARSNVHHSAVHTNLRNLVTRDRLALPVVTHTLMHSETNITHPAPLVPIRHNLLQDLSVIPLHKHAVGEAKVRSRTAENGVHSEGVHLSQYRTFYGGYGTGLLFGGHGAGHGFYAYG